METKVFVKGMIVSWSGAVADIPGGFALCDGNNGTPNLTDKFIVGAGDTYNPADTGGTVQHTHADGDHNHILNVGSNVESGEGLSSNTGDMNKPDPIGMSGTLPPYHALCYIMKL